MRDYGRVYSSFWTSADMQALSDDGRMLALYLLSGPHCTIAGVCRLPDGYVCEDLRWTQLRVTQGFSELSRKGFVSRCETTKWVWVRKFIEWNTPENPNQWKAARKVAAQVPDNCSFRSLFSRQFAIAAGDEPPEDPNPSATLPEPSPTQDQDQDQDQDQEQKGAAAPKRKPCGSQTEPPEFLAIREVYPKRAGTQRWTEALANCRRLVGGGVPWADLLAAAERYARFCGATGKVGTETTMQAASFYGKNQCWREDYAPPVAASRQRAKTVAELEAEAAARG